MSRRAILEIDGIDVFYGASQILFGVSFDVERGQSLALLGRNGAGKSTTMKAIIGLAPPRRGDRRAPVDPVGILVRSLRRREHPASH